VTDASSLPAALDGCATVYHVAGVPEQWRRDVDEFARVNVGGTRNVVEAALEAGVERFVYTSTMDVLVQTPGLPYDEAVIDPSPCPTPYQRSKQEADRVVTAGLERGLPAVFLHPSGVYGEAPFLTAGLNDLLVRLVKGKVPVLLPGGMAVVYIDDLADGHVRAATRGRVGARYILSESFQTLTDIARAVRGNDSDAKVPRVMSLGIARVVSRAGERVARTTNRPPMIPRGVLQFLELDAHPSAAHARAELGWEPMPFARGLDRTLEYFREQGWT
jgi:dihydroflavonol-4-reductase